ncbi:MAG: hypothetical protein EZS28_029355 [Streblomastix strix]|uniref:Uncharacterized protein n=1 Tax=Streblomastix strix TaxID=222440 RepID=A0A5J4UY52_9EUKA|nr:MAG: hypothetical protein EZS28_029355 [Streblomastix strix]
MIYYSLKGNDVTVGGAKVLNIANTILANSTADILLMKILANETYDTLFQEQQYGKTVYSKASKHGLIYVESLNKGDSQGISPVHIEVSGIFVIGCHYSVGSGISITKLLMELTDSVFIEPSCYSNMIYLNRTLGTIEDYYSINSVILNETKVFGLRVDKGTAMLDKISFIEAEILE